MRKNHGDTRMGAHNTLMRARAALSLALALRGRPSTSRAMATPCTRTHSLSLSLSLSFSVSRLFLHPVPAPALAGSRNCFIRVPDRSKQSPEFPGWVVLSGADTLSFSFSLSRHHLPFFPSPHFCIYLPRPRSSPPHLCTSILQTGAVPAYHAVPYGKTDRR
ncbi:hypothetical protein LY78DRAFT_420558 [Colletotrichum sublineola]|nr:hypothetical protein LY78DRAFT_420558 [Colletotrichum sublineola]